VERDEIFDS